MRTNSTRWVAAPENSPNVIRWAILLLRLDCKKKELWFVLKTKKKVHWYRTQESNTSQN
jgi:hypothetical protein